MLLTGKVLAKHAQSSEHNLQKQLQSPERHKHDDNGLDPDSDELINYQHFVIVLQI
jgi:hypothetical protein